MISRTSLLPKKASTKNDMAVSVHFEATVPRQPKRQWANNKKLKMAQEIRVNRVLCNRCWANRSSKNKKPEAMARVRSTVPALSI